MNNFNYKTAFSRNIGWVTEAEQSMLCSKRIAIAGMGGVGGGHLLTLTRLGVGAFNIADFDTFEIANFNRQAGATISSLGKPKVEMLAGMARDINPDLKIRQFSQGVDKENLEDFLQGVDLFVDGLDFFEIPVRRAVFAACYHLNIPAITAAPLGMGAAVVVFQPGGMTFDQYFCLEGCCEEEIALRFLVGLSPAMLQRGYLVDFSQVDFVNRRGPSTIMACQLCSGLASTEALKILLGRGKVLAAPFGYQLDSYKCRLVKTWRPGGNRNILQRITIWSALRIIRQMRKSFRVQE